MIHSQLPSETPSAGAVVREANRSPARKRLARLAGAVCAALLAGCGEPEIETSPNVVLITLDSLTASHMSCYGYERDTSPHIDAFADGATLYRRALSTAPWTLPTHASIMTGKYPFEHGAHTFKLGKRQLREYPLEDSFLTLAEALRAEGFATAAITANTGYLDPRWKLDQGFDRYINRRVGGAMLNTAAFAWLEKHADQPFFLFLNYMDTHSPYEIRKPSRRPDFLGHVTDRQADPLFKEFMRRMEAGEDEFPAEGLQKLTDLYDIGIANVDEYLHELFEKLRELGVFDETVIVLTSDHGEYFGEHGLVEHGKDVYHGGLWIPLIVKKQHQSAGEVVEREISSADIPRLILERFPPDVANRYLPEFTSSLAGPLVVSENYYVYPAFGRLMQQTRFNRYRSVVYDWPFKLIHSSDGKHELYDLEADPAEAVNLIEREAERAAEMAQRLEAFKAERGVKVEPGEPAVAPTPEQIEELRALGYFGR